MHRRLALTFLLVASCGKRSDAPEDPIARARALSFPQVVELAPFGLLAKTPAGYACESDGASIVCAPPDGVFDWRVGFRLVAEDSTEPIEALVDGDKPESDFASRLGKPTIAGFRGHLDRFDGVKRPSMDVNFRGWRDLRGVGRARLDVNAAGFGRDIDATRAAAMVLATTEAAGGLPRRLVTPEDLATLRDAQHGYHALAGDGGAATWTGGASDVARVTWIDAGAARDWLASRKPSAVELLATRAAAHDATPAGFRASLEMGRAAQRLDLEAGARILADLASDLRRAWSFDRADASEWAELELRVADARDAVAETAAHLGGLDRAVVLHEPRASLDVLAARKDDRVASALLARWLEPTNVPSTADHQRLATFVADHTSTPAARRFCVAMLANRTALADNRVCDVYATAMARKLGAPFDAGALIPQRDREIQSIRLALSEKK
ncbi:MAG TPA: hypothetical protein VIF62_07135 [Labilithrix sp.]